MKKMLTILSLMTVSLTAGAEPAVYSTEILDAVCDIEADAMLWSKGFRNIEMRAISNSDYRLISEVFEFKAIDKKGKEAVGIVITDTEHSNNGVVSTTSCRVRKVIEY